MADLIALEGDALKSGVLNTPNKFRIIMAGMNTSKLQVEMKGPTLPQIQQTNQKDGNAECSYTTATPGEYTLNITFDDDHVEGSPFTVVVA